MEMSMTTQYDAPNEIPVATSALLLDHDAATRALIGESLEELGWQTSATDSGLKAVELLEHGNIDIFIADLDAPGPDSMELVRRALHENPGLHAVLIVAAETAAKAEEGVRLRVADYLVRPFDAGAVKRVLARLAEKHSALDRKPALSPEVERVLATMVGDSEPMQKVREDVLVAAMATNRVPVLVLGETGTGKELAARAIHACSAWRDQLFRVVDCASLSPTLMESELFGHVKDAFTGANRARVGLLASAGSGTVFFDEIGELTNEHQARLLRVLQEHEVRPLGSNEMVKVQARVIAATNVDLKEAVRSGNFREDLYFRLKVFKIHMPPLRERKSDILPLVHHFLARSSAGERIADFSPEFMNLLMRYDWPGNVRELENTVNHAVAHCAKGVKLDVKHLPSTLIYRSEGRNSGRRDVSRLQALERAAIIEALRSTKGDRARAAKMLGIGKTTIYRKLKEYHLEDEGLN